MRSHSANKPPLWSLEVLEIVDDVEPVSLSLARDHLRLTALGSPATHPDDGLVLGLITAARENVESYCGRALLLQKLRYRLDRFPSNDASIRLPRPPLIDLVSFKVAGAALAEGADFEIVADAAHVELAPKRCWPASSAPSPNLIEIVYRSGHVTGSPPAVLAAPKSIQFGMLLLIAHWYENREAVLADSRAAAIEMPLAVDRLLSPWIARGLL